MRPITGITILGFRLAVIVVVAYWSLLFVGTHLPAGPEIGPKINDKLLHFSGYFVLALLCCYATQSTRGDRRAAVRRFSRIIFFLLAYAAIDEATQAFSPGRSPDVLDFLADACGVASAIAVYIISRRIYYRHRPESDPSRQD